MNAPSFKSEFIARELVAARSAARWLLGEEYESKIEPWRDAVRKLAAQWKCSPLLIPVRLRKEGAFPEHPLLLFAAVVDVLDSAPESPGEA